MAEYPVISLLEEIKARIAKAKTAGAISYKDIFIGDYSHIRKLNDYPIVVIAPESFTVDPVGMAHITTNTLTFNIVYVTNKLTDNNNKLYNTVSKTGALYDLDTIQNYLEKKTTDGSVNLNLNNTAFDLAKPSVTFDYSADDVIRIIIKYTVKTKTYQRGAR